MRHISIQTSADGVALVTLDNADESMNLASGAWMAEMTDAIAQIAADGTLYLTTFEGSQDSRAKGAIWRILPVE